MFSVHFFLLSHLFHSEIQFYIKIVAFGLIFKPYLNKKICIDFLTLYIILMIEIIFLKPFHFKFCISCVLSAVKHKNLNSN